MSGRKSRRKGANWERATANALTEALGDTCRRNLTECQVGNAGDVVLPDWVPLSVQCKAGAQPPIYPAIREAEEAAAPGAMPLAVIKRTYGPGKPSDELAVLRLQDFYAIVRQLVEAGIWTS